MSLKPNHSTQYFFRLLSIAFLSLSFFSTAYSQVPLDEETGKITYVEVVNVEETEAGMLYERALKWVQGYYKNPTNVLRDKDKEKGRIVIKARYRLNNPPDKKGVVTSAGDAMYTLTIRFRDGRFRYEVTDINWMKLSAFPGERWLDKDADTYLPVYDHYVKMTDKKVQEVIESLTNSVSTADKVKSDDW